MDRGIMATRMPAAALTAYGLVRHFPEPREGIDENRHIYDPYMGVENFVENFSGGCAARLGICVIFAA